MQKFYYNLLRSLLLIIALGATTAGWAQPTDVNTGPFTSNTFVTGNSVITFVVENTNPYDIIVKQVKCTLTTTNNNTVPTLWYSSSSLAGAVNVTTPTWTQIMTGTAVPVPTSGIYDMFSGLSFTVPGGAVYRFALQMTVGAYYGNSTADPNSFSAGGVTVKVGNATVTGQSGVVGYAGAMPNPANQPRYFWGGITFEPASPCLTPPYAGTVTSTTTTVCTGTPFSLSLTGGTGGMGQTYQWQASADSINWSNIASATNATYNTSQSATTYYRAIATCSGSSDTTAGLRVFTPASVSGVFTINQSQPTAGTNFANFNDAINYIKCGINGPVIINVEPGSGPYNEKVTIPQIGGASATNTITINGNGETLNYNTSDVNNRVALWLNGADHITIDSLVIDVSQSTVAGWNILLSNQADSNTIRKCSLVNNITSTSSNYSAVILSGSSTSISTSGNNGNGNLFAGNTITGGYYGFYLYGNSTVATQNVNNRILNNVIKDNYSYAVYAAYLSGGLLVARNDISRPNRTNSTTVAGVYLTTGTVGATVEKNKIYNMFPQLPTSTSTFYGVYVGVDGTASQPTRVINNLVYGIAGNGAQYGIYNSGADFMQAYHNTIVLDDQGATTGTTYGFYQTTQATGIDFRNNIVHVARGGTGIKRVLYFATTTSSIISNNNVLYLLASTGTNNHLAQYGGTNYTTLPDWKTANSGAYDQLSVSVDPLYTNASGGEFTPTEAAVNGVGAAVGVTTDIQDTTRSTTSPDPGAYEFTLAGTDADISWVSPVMPVTAGLKTITVNVTNTQTVTINSINLSYTDQTNVVTQNFTGLNLAAGQSQQFSFTTQYNLNSNVKLRAYINTVNGAADNSQANDSTAVQTFCLPMSGTYTINNGIPTGGNNFASISEAMTQLGCSGVTGPVTFDVSAGSGPYTDMVVIPQIPGASSTNKITILGNGVTLSHNPTDANNRTAITFNGADHVTLDSLIIDMTAGTTAGWGIVLMNKADSNTIKNCVINNNTTSTSTNFSGIFINGSNTTTASTGDNGSYNKIINNTINGGYYGIYLYGNSSSTTQNMGNELRGNIVKDNYSYSIYAVYQSSGLVVSKNDISRPTRTTSTTAAGVYLTTNTRGALVEKNRIHNMFDAFPTSTSTFYGVYVGTDGTAAMPNIIANNLVYAVGGNGAAYGIYNSGGDTMRAYHNTIVLDETSTTSGGAYGLYQTTAATGIEFLNNIVYITRSGTGTKRAVFFNTNTSGITSNRNVFYFNPTSGTNNHLGQWGTTNFTTLANWKTANASAYDQGSIGEDPVFQNPALGEFEPTNSLLDNLGTFVGITTDIQDSIRSTTTPDPGAYEFSTLTSGVNMSAVGLITPATAARGCYTATEPVTIRIRNASTSTIDFAVNPVTVTTIVSGAVTQTLSVVINSGTLASDSFMNVVMTQPLNMTVPGTYTFDAATSVAGDVNTANDAMLPVNRTREALTSGSVAVSPSSYCSSSPINPTLSATGANGYSGLQWQQSSSATTGYSNITGATTTNFTLASAPTQAMYYRLVSTCAGVSDTSTSAALSYSNPQITATVPDTTCGTGSVTLQASANPGAVINWYANATGGMPVATGTSYTTTVTNTTNFYVAASDGGANYSVGMAAPSASPTAGSGTTNFGLVFDVYAPFTLNSVTIYPVSATSTPVTVKIDIIDANNNILHTATVTVPGSPASTPVPQVVNLNFNLQPGTNLKMRPGSISGGGTQLLFESSTAPAPVYPYAVPGVVSINTSTLTAAPTNTPRNDLYYYFYNWQISTGCESARTAVEAYVDNTPGCSTVPVTGLVFKGERSGTTNKLSWSTVTEINNAGFELQNSVDGINFGKFAFVGSKAEGGNSAYPLSYAYDHVNAPQATMYYRLKQVDKDGRSTYSNVVVIKGARSAEMLISSLYPNPATDKVNMVLSAPAAQKVQVLVTDLTGRVINTRNLSLISGDNNIQLDIASLPQGSYFVKVVCSNGCESAVRKFVK